jgi:hypothetical protein
VYAFPWYQKYPGMLGSNSAIYTMSRELVPLLISLIKSSWI